MSDFNALVMKQGILFSLLRYISFVISFLGQLLLVRFLFPEDFGQYAILVGVIEIVSAFTLSGIQNAAIKFQNLPYVIENSFVLATLAAVITALISLIILFFTQTVFDFDNANSAFAVLVLSKSLAGFSSVYAAHLLKDMNFTSLGIAEVFSNLIGMVVGLSMALIGFGFLSLIFKEVATSSVRLFWLRKVSKLRLRFRFDIAVMKKLLLFIKSILLLSVSSILILRSPSVIFGIFETKAFVGLYDRTYYLIQLPNTLLSPVLSNFSFTLFSRISDDKDKIKQILDLKIFILARIILPVFIVLNFFSEFIVLLLGVNWVNITSTVEYLSLLVITLPLMNIAQQYMLSIDKVWKVIFIRLIALTCLFTSYAFYKSGLMELEAVFLTFSVSLFIGALYVVKNLFEGYLSIRCYEIFGLYISLLLFPALHTYILGIFILFDVLYNKNIYARILSLGKLIFNTRLEEISEISKVNKTKW